MRRQIKKLALLAVFGLASVSCTKENVVNDTDIVVTAYTASYIVDGQQFYLNPQTDEEWSAFLDRMLALAEEGYTVHFWRAGVQASSSKEKLTYTTGNYEEAKEWCKQKKDEGYWVTITYDQLTGQYTCIAVR